MNTHIIRPNSKQLFLLVLLIVFIPQTIQSDNGDPTIIFLYEDSSEVRIEFTEQELEEVRRNPSYVITKIKRRGEDCCEPRKKISRCIWRCCDDKTVKTCNETLIAALEQVWGK